MDKGYKVILKDANIKGLARGQEQISKGLATAVKRRKFTRYQWCKKESGAVLRT